MMKFTQLVLILCFITMYVGIVNAQSVLKRDKLQVTSPSGFEIGEYGHSSFSLGTGISYLNATSYGIFMGTDIAGEIADYRLNGLTIQGNSTSGIVYSFLDKDKFCLGCPYAFTQDSMMHVVGGVEIEGSMNLTSGDKNTFIGEESGELNLATSIGNTGFGQRALSKNTTGDNNTAIGRLTLRESTTGSLNTAIGYKALQKNTTATGNTALGHSALFANLTGQNNTAIGRQAYLNGIDYDNSTAVGYSTVISASNQIRIGNNSITSIGGYANWSNVSDKRFKRKVKDNVPGLEFISLLKPVTYQMDMDAIAKFHKTPDSLRLLKAEAEKGVIRYTGFLAQEVEAAAKTVDYDFSGVDKPAHEDDNYSLRYAEFVVPLVKAVQELSEENEEKEDLIAELRTEVSDMRAELEEIKALLVNQKKTTNTSVHLEDNKGATLEQNTPNPFQDVTTIEYFLPETTQSAQLRITDSAGRFIKSLELEGTGKGQVNISTSKLSTGTYQYTLIIDGRRIATKKMVLTTEK